VIRIIAQYRIREGTVDEVLPAIRRFVRAVAEAEPETEYRSYRMADSLEFLHVMAFPDETAEERHREATYTLEFVDVLYPHCVEPPRFARVELVS
jgi:quinol monooxygenase YgiN